MLACILMIAPGRGPSLAPVLPAPSARLQEDASAGRAPMPSPYAEREAGSRDLEEFTGGGEGLAVLIVLVVAVVVLVAILAPWSS
jgi:hypothetical protein